MPKGYLYADIVVTDPEEYEKYRQLVPDTIAAYGGRYLVRGGSPEVLEGEKRNIRSVILEFESRERLLEWYHSADYKDVREIRFRAAITNAVVMTGAD
jgi:uncharacterized protein (DUF1330 family)